MLSFSHQTGTWEHMQILDTLLGLREVTVQNWNYCFTFVNLCLLMILIVLPQRIDSALPRLSFALVAMGRDTIDSLGSNLKISIL
jgi:hypothetical protein